MRWMVFGLMMMVGPCWAQGPTQGRSGLGTGSHLGAPTNSLPAGSLNATTGPQAQPAYPSGSTTANPGAAFVQRRPVPQTGPLKRPPGALSTTTFGPGGTVTRPGGAAGITGRPGVAPRP